MPQVEELVLQRTMQLIAQRARALMDARAAVVELGYGDELVVMAAEGAVPDGLVGRRAPLRGTLAGMAIRSGQVQSLDDPLNRARFQRGTGRFGVQARRGLAVPLHLSDGVRGAVLIIDRDHDGGFTIEDARLLEGLVAGAAVAAACTRELTRDLQRQRLDAAEAERRRWARELHDDTLQGLAAAALRLADTRDQTTSAFADAHSLLIQEICNLRALIRDLRPLALRELGLTQAIQALGDAATEGRISVRVDVELDAAEMPASEGASASQFEISVYRIAQEALANARKHACADEVSLRLRTRGGALHLEVRDDGVGYDTDTRGRGFGMLGMREHAEAWGGLLMVESVRGAGTSLKAILPIPTEAATAGPDGWSGQGRNWPRRRSSLVSVGG